MSRVTSTEPLDRVLYIHHSGKPSEAYLRENISEEAATRSDGTAVSIYVADEVHIRTDLSESEVEECFDELWVAAETRDTPIEERIANLEELVGILIDEALGVE